MARPRRLPARPADVREEPFASAEQAWFWFVAAALARAEGARPAAGLADPPRPCLPEDIQQAVERLYRSHRLHRRHLVVLSEGGRAFLAPGNGPRERAAARLWEEAMAALDEVLRARGIVR